MLNAMGAAIFGRFLRARLLVVSTRPSRWSWTTMWAVAIVLLLPALAWLQYSWLDQIAVADRERRERTVRTSATQLAQEFDLELGKAFFALQVDHGPLGDQGAVAYAARYASWSSAATNPRMVQAVYRASAPPDGAAADVPLQLQRWNPTAQRFDPLEWPAEMQTLATRLREQLEQMGRRALFRRGEGLPPPPFQPDDPAMMVAPIVHVSVDEQPIASSRPAEVRVVGFTIVQLDLGVLTSEMLPVFVRRHFADENGHSDFRVAVVNGEDDTQVLFESEAGAAVAALNQPDTSTPLMAGHGRPFMMVARGERGDRSGAISGRFDQPPAPPRDGRMVINILERRRAEGLNAVETRAFGAAGDGHWRLVAKHRAGSLEAAVTSARTRNFALSSGILLVLSAAIGLIIVSARRADRLGRQQMEFVATVSHELRTPVSVIGAAAGNLADGVVAEPARVRHYGETIRGEARRLAETVERVLQLAGIAAGRAVSLETLSPAALVDDALQASSAEIEAAGFDVDVDVPGQLPLISGDRTALRSAVQNLIGNALKYGRDGQWMRISARATTVSMGRNGRQTQGAVEISVTDRGPGIPLDDRSHIFEAFYRGRHAVTHQIQGSGLGLHLVQRIVEAHGGRVAVDSESSPGCRFTITLPAVDSSAASEHSMSGEVLRHDPAPGHPALEPGRSH